MFFCISINYKAIFYIDCLKKLQFTLLSKRVQRKSIHSQSKYRALIYGLSIFVCLSTESISSQYEISVSSGAVTTPLIHDSPGSGGFPFLITGSGVFCTPGTNTYAGMTIIGGASGSGLGGNMLVTGRVGSTSTPFTVSPTGTLMGSGTVVGSIVNAGNLSPSNNREIPNDTGPPLAPGTTLTITGSYSQAASAFLNLFSTPSACDRLSVSGLAMCGGTLVINPVGNYPPTGVTFRIMTWGSVAGTFSNITSVPNKSVSLETEIDDFGMNITISGNSTLVTSSGTTVNNLATVTGGISVDNGATISNDSGTQTVSAAFVSIVGTSTFNTTAGSTTILATPISSTSSTTLNINGGGTTIFSADNSGLLGNVAVSGSTINVSSNLGSGDLQLTNATVNLESGSTINNQVSGDSSTVINLSPETKQISVNKAFIGQESVNVITSGTTIFNSPNPLFSGSFTLGTTGCASTAQITDGADLGTGKLNLGTTSADTPTVVMGKVTLPNPIAANAATTFTTNSSASLTGSITGSANLTFTGSGTTSLTGNSIDYTGTLNVLSGKVSINSNFQSAVVNVGNGATLTGTATVGDVVLSSGANVKAGNSSTSKFNANSWQSSDATYTVNVKSDGEANTIVVTNDATLIRPTFDVYMDATTYDKGAIDYVVLQSGGALSITGPVTINWVNPISPTTDPISFTMGTRTNTKNDVTTNYLVLKATLSEEVIISSDQTSGTNDQIIYSSTFDPLAPITIGANDIIAENSGLLPSTAPVAQQVELTSLVFNKISATSDPSASATADSFRFKETSRKGGTYISTKKDAVETLLTAISKTGPVSYERNETRLWITPYVNRTRVNRTNSDTGNQGWSGGSLVGIEQRDEKNIWSLGILGGLMGSRSHMIGVPDTFSKTTGILFGGFNTYKYSDHKDQGNFGHELLISRTITSIDAQRYGLDNTNNNTPFYALSTYKTTTDIGNAQINYLFDIIKKSVTCRLSSGSTYTGTNYGSYEEYNAGSNGLTQSSNFNKSIEFYNGIGIRKIWNHNEITIRTTFVYEYGYEMINSGTASKTTTHSAISPITFSTPPGPRQNKHYLQLSSSYLDRETGLKFILSYAGVLHKNVQNHIGMFKFEYRFQG